jgi:nucleotide-binding universal stress UspA family protein
MDSKAGQAEREAVTDAPRVELRAGDGRSEAAHSAESAADLLSDSGDRVAERLEQTAKAIREHDAGSVAEELRRYATEHPIQAIVAGVVGGFLVSRLFLH